MINYVYLIPLFPLIGFLINGLGWRTIPKNIGGVIGSVSVLVSFIISLIIFFEVKDGRLIEKLPNGLELPLLAASDEIFYLENFNTSFQFTKVKGVERVVIHEHGKDFVLRKVY